MEKIKRCLGKIAGAPRIVKMNKVAIIGFGNIGKRHLEGLLKSKHSLDIFLVDPNMDFLKNKNNVILENKIIHKIHFMNNSKLLPSKIDVAIISTTSSVRKAVIESLIETVQLKYLILEKIVFQEVVHFKYFKELFSDNNITAFVNCPMRGYKIFKDIKKSIRNKKISLTNVGNGWGLACNSIHVIDLFWYLSGASKLFFNNTKLHSKTYQSKREGFVELKGELSVRSEKDDLLIINDTEDYNFFQKIIIKLDNSEYSIDLTERNHYHKLENQNTSDIYFKFPFQSELTGNYIDELIDSSNIRNLPSFNDCSEYHIPMLETFIDHISLISKRKITNCPIT